MIGRCPICPEKERLIAEKDDQIRYLKSSLDERDKKLLALTDKAAFGMVYPKERTQPQSKTKPGAMTPDELRGQLWEPEPGRRPEDIEALFELDKAFDAMAAKVGS